MLSNKLDVIEIDEKPGASWYPSWLSWRPTSGFHLFLAETRILSRLNSHVESFFVPIFQSKERLRSLLITRPGMKTATAVSSSMSLQDPAEQREATAAAAAPLTATAKDYLKRCPIVLVHGMAAGVAMWVKNLDSLAEDRPVYCFDLLGFGRSSRPCDMPPIVNKQNKERFLQPASEYEDIVDQRQIAAALTESQFVESLEEWRSQLGLPKMVLVGHSLGGYLSFAYALRYPERVEHLVLADPWGFNEYNDTTINRHGARFRYVYNLARIILKPFNPLSVLRISGPFGPSLIKRFRPDLGRAFNIDSNNPSDASSASQEAPSSTPEPTDNSQSSASPAEAAMNEASDKGCILDYIYHINAQYPACGESAFKSLSEPIGWAARPMVKRVKNISPNLPITFIFGARSWMDSEIGTLVQYLRGADCATHVHELEGAGHHVYVQAYKEFNEIVKSSAQTAADLTEEQWETFNQPSC